MCTSRFSHITWVTIVLSIVLHLVGCGGGGGGGGNPNGESASSHKISVSGIISPPSGVEPSSLSIISLGQVASVSSQGEFSVDVYKDGVTLVAAMPSGKDLGLMNIVVRNSAQATESVIAASVEAGTTIKLDATTTAVSMVFLTPYFLTSNQVKAAELIGIIEKDAQVANLAVIIEKVFQNSDPLEDPEFQQALIKSVQSVLNTLASQQNALSAQNLNTKVLSSVNILEVPKMSMTRALLSAVYTDPVSANTYYSYHDYVDLSVTANGLEHDISEESKLIGSVDWVAEVIKLDPSQFSSLNDFNLKASASSTVFTGEGSDVLGGLAAPARSLFKYVDIIGDITSMVSYALFEDILDKSVSVPSTEDGVYLIRSYSGSWSNKDMKNFVLQDVPNGAKMDRKAVVINLVNVAVDAMSIFIDISDMPDRDKVISAGASSLMEYYFSELGNSEPPSLNDLGPIVINVAMEMVKKSVSTAAKQSLASGVKNIAKIIGKSVIDYSGKISSGGQIADRIYQMLSTATAIETSLVVVGNPWTSPSENKYSVSGRITYNGIGLAGVTITIGQTSTGISKKTDENGNYSFTDIANGSYTLSASLTGYSFNPSSIAVTVNNGNLPVQDIVATISAANVYNVYGRVTYNGTGLAGVTITLSGSTSRSTVTDSNGTYTFTNVVNGSYTLTPSLAGYSFNPSSINVTVNNGNATVQDVSATGNSNLTITPQISAGTEGTFGLKSDGTVVAVGYNDYGQCNVSDWTDIVQVSASNELTVGLKSNGTVVAVGNNDYGQLGVSNWTDIIQVSAGTHHTVGLKSNGTVVAVGSNWSGESAVSSWTDIIQVSAGTHNTVGVKSNGTVVVAGTYLSNESDMSNWTDIIQVSASTGHTVGLKSNGTVVAVGNNNDGECNVSSWTDIIQVSAGLFHTVGLKSNGTVVAEGDNYSGQLGVSGWTDIVQVSANSSFTMGLKSNGTVVAVGSNSYGQCNVEGWDLTP